MLEHTSTVALQAAAYLANCGEDSLNGMVRLSQEWTARLPVDDPRRGNLLRLQALSGSVVKDGVVSSLAMTYLRVLLCTSCRRLDAAQGRCFGQTLDRCLLLNASGQ